MAKVLKTKEIKFYDSKDRLIKKKLIVDTTDTIELVLIKKDVRLVLVHMPFALFIIYSNLIGSSWSLKDVIVEKK